MPPRARNAWFKTLGQLGLVLAGALVLGLLLRQAWPVLAVAALGVVAWHYWKLRGVLLRLTARQRIEPPQGDGVWNELDRLLHFFMTHPERGYSRGQLLDHVWGGSVSVEERTVDVHIRRLRRTLEATGLDAMVQTVRGAGYRFSTAL